MSVELTHEFNQIVKHVEFFPYEWSSNLLAVCFTDSVKLFVYHDNSFRKEESNEYNAFINQEPTAAKQRKLQLIGTVPFQQKIEQFSWSPKTSIASLKQNINFAISDCTQNLVFCNFNLNSQNEQLQSDNQSSNIKLIKEKVDVDCIFNISYDTHNGDLLAFTADSFCFLWDCVENKIRARFLLQSPGIQICWNRNERTKLMVGEKSGLIRIYSIETMKPVYSLMSNLKIEYFPLISFDWSESNPEVIIANTSNSIYIWNTSKSCIPEGSVDNFKRLRMIKLSQLKENLIGFIDGRDAASKFTLLNIKSNQVIYQTDNFKLLSSFSFNAVQPLIAISTEQQVIFIKSVN